MTEKLKDRRGSPISRLDLLKFELVAPSNKRTPDELIGCNDDEDNYADAAEEGGYIVGLCRRLHVTAETGKLEISVAHGEHFTEHESEPSAGNRDNGVPDQADGGIGHFKLPEALPGRIAVNTRGLDHLAGGAFERGEEAEGKV